MMQAHKYRALAIASVEEALLLVLAYAFGTLRDEDRPRRERIELL